MILTTIFTNIDSFDARLLFWIHEHLHSDTGNAILPYFRKAKFWIPLYAVLLAFFIKWWKWKAWIPTLFLAASIGLSDLISVHLFKNNILRLRPCHTYESDPRLDLLIPCGGQYGFVSSHASNHMAMAVFLMCLFAGTSPKLRWIWFFWAFMIGFSQVYVGVHYPLDVFCGFILGGVIGFIMSRINSRYFPEFFSFRS